MKSILILLLMFCLSNCDRRIINGTIIDMKREPLVVTEHLHNITVRPMHYVRRIHYDNEDFILTIENERIVRKVYVSKQRYDTLEIGQYFVVDEYCRSYDYNNTEKNK